MTTLLSHESGPGLVEAARVLMGRARPEDQPRWLGFSGYRVTGGMVAAHVEAAAGLMEREGWDPQLYDRAAGRHVRDALEHVVRDGAGDSDTLRAAGDLIEVLLRAASGAAYVDYEVWSEHPRTTLPQVLAVLRDTAALARATGPAG